MTSQNHTACFDMPPSISREVGRIITRSGYLQNHIQKTIYLLAGVSEEIGRVSIREPRLSDRIEMILDLIAIRKLKTPDVDFKHVKGVIDDAEEFRNLCAHGAWACLAERGTWVVQVTRGSWPDRDKNDRAKRSKRISPQGQIIEKGLFADYVERYEQLIAVARNIRGELLQQLAALPQIQLSQSPGSPPKR